MTNKINSKKLEPHNFNNRDDLDSAIDFDGAGTLMSFPPSDREFSHNLQGDEDVERIDWDDARMYLIHNRGSDEAPPKNIVEYLLPFG